MKRSELIFSFLLVPIDFAMIILSGMIVYFIRYNTFLVQLRPPVFEIETSQYLKILFIVALLWLIMFAIARMYSTARSKRMIEELRRVILGCSAGLVLIVMVIFFRHELFGSRFLVLAGFFTSIVFVFLGRLIIRSFQRSLYKKRIGVCRSIVIGDNYSSIAFLEALRRDSGSGYFVVRHFKKLDSSSFGLFSNIAKSNGADMVILADYNHTREETLKLWQFCKENHLDFLYAADVLESKVSNVEVSELCGTPVVYIKRTSLDGWGRIAKRILDIIFSFVTLVVLAPFFIIFAIAIKIDSSGSVFVRLARIGDGGKKFKLYKFRSMVKDAHKMKTNLSEFNERMDGPLFKMKNDPRITSIGKFLRKWSIDELPNFINVLKGDISLVGPRPHEPEEVKKYEGRHRSILNIKPGITGLAQISGRSNLSFEEEARLDLFYIENWSIMLDMSILVRTPFVVMKGKNAV